MMTKLSLPYWAEEYVAHIRVHRPRMYKELKATGQLENVALSVDRSASNAYERMIQSYIAQGINEDTAEMFADSETMRQYICLPTEADMPDLGNEPNFLPEVVDGEIEPEDLSGSQDLNTQWDSLNDSDVEPDEEIDVSNF
jgi:hypothetical protein